ncbi:MAG: PGF-CTERM sorting domain-containing protein [Euryarchaeota archaeon]|nr:PGF-CTERM sorting domain-containing protein [Euryarchaeota archaeon]
MNRDIICKILVTALFLTLLTGNACATDVNLNSSIDARELADELTADGWVMYGTEQCGWCTRQKDEFGDAFANVTHIDCNKNGQACRNVSMYLFSWDDATGAGSRLFKYLEDTYRAGWVKNAEINRSDDDMTIHISDEDNSAGITLDEGSGVAILQIGGRAHYLKVEKEGGKTDIYAGIEGIPCWVSPDSTLHPGYHNLTRLSGLVSDYRAAHPAPTPTTEMSTSPATTGFESVFALMAMVIAASLMRKR